MTTARSTTVKTSATVQKTIVQEKIFERDKFYAGNQQTSLARKPEKLGCRHLTT